MELSGHLTYDEAVYRGDKLEPTVTYEISLDATGNDLILGSARINLTMRESTDGMWLDYAGKVTALLVNSHSIPIHHLNNKLYLGYLQTGNSTLYIEFVSKYNQDGTGMHLFTDPYDGLVYKYTYLCPFYANKVFPCFDQPDIKGRFTFQISTTAQNLVISNESVSTIDPQLNDGMIYTFHETPPLSTYVICITVGPFRCYEDLDYRVPLRIFSRQSIGAYIPYQSMFEWTKKGIEYYESLFGLEFPFRKYDSVFCPEFIMGAMEGAGCVCFNDSYVWKETPVKSEISRFCCTLLHELSHMWFGNMVTLKWWDDLWLNEAFATYISFRAMDEALEWDNWMEFTLRKEQGFSADRLNAHPIKVPVSDTHEATQNLDEITYDKGSAIIQQLVWEMGKDEFFKGISKYLSRHAWKNVTSIDLYQSIESQISGLSTSEWMDQWVNKLGLNSLELVQTGDSYFIKQGIVSGQTLRRSLISVRHYTQDLDFIQEFKIEVHDQQMNSCVALEGLSGVFLLNSRNECFFDIYLPESYLPNIFHNDNLYKLPLIERAVCWKHLWAMVENNRLPANSFLSYLTSLLQYETEEEIIDYLHNFSLKAIFNYLPYEYISTETTKIISIFRFLLDFQFKFSKNLQRHIFQYLFSEKDIQDHYEWSKQLARSERWRGIMSLCTTLRISQVTDILNIELRNDSTDMAHKFKTYCEAAAVDNKESYWYKIIHKDARSFTLLEMMMRGFNIHRQRQLLMPFLDRYFQHLTWAIENEQMEITEKFMKSMLPLWADPAYVIDKLRQIQTTKGWAQKSVANIIEDLARNKEKQDLVRKNS